MVAMFGLTRTELDSFLPQGLEALAAGVVELAAASAALAGFSDLYCPAAQNYRFLHTFMVRTFSPTIFLSSMSEANLSKTNSVS